MGNQSPELSKIKVNRYPDGKTRLTLNAGFLFKLNLLHLAEEGHTFFETAEQDPTAAYDYLRQAVRESVGQNAGQVTTNNKRVASIEVNGIEATHQIAQENILGCLPASFEGPFSLSVHLFTTPEEESMGFGESSQIMQLSVTPPSLAA